MRWLVLSAMLLMIACSDLQTAMTDAKKAETAITNAVGGEAKVGFRIHNGHLRVSVFFKQLPTKNLSLAELKATIAPVVAASFEKTVEELTITF